jgi:hypothetical protein
MDGKELFDVIVGHGADVAAIRSTLLEALSTDGLDVVETALQMCEDAHKGYGCALANSLSNRLTDNWFLRYPSSVDRLELGEMPPLKPIDPTKMPAQPMSAKTYDGSRDYPWTADLVLGGMPASKVDPTKIPEQPDGVRDGAKAVGL